MYVIRVMTPQSPNPERDRLETMFLNGELEIVARRKLKDVKTYEEYKAEAKLTNARINAKYAAKPGAHPPTILDISI